MDPKELDARLRRIIGDYRNDGRNKRTCWLDGDICPYGQPEGRFSLRPRQSCHPNGEIQGSGCRKIDEHLDELRGSICSDGEFILTADESNEYEEWKRKQESANSLSHELRDLGNNMKNNRAREVLTLAADLIRESGLDGRIIFLDDD